MCIFETPLFNLSGASKIDCTGITGTSYVITTATTIPVTFQFTANTNTFTAVTAVFKYEIYKFNTSANAFILPPVYKSDLIQFSAISATSFTVQNIPINVLSLDGEYLIKGYYEYNVCTEFMNRLGKKIDTLANRSGSEFGLYDKNLDYYFIAINQAEIPKLLLTSSNTPVSNSLFQQNILPLDGQTILTIIDNYSGFFILTLNGLVLANNYDFSVTGNVITLDQPTVSGDIITIIYTTTGGNNLIGDNIVVNSPVISGITNQEGSNLAYFNSTTNKYEIYTSVLPSENSTILVMINGVTLSNGIDYYRSTTNPKRIILVGDIQLNDIITIVYFPTTNVINGLNTNLPVVSWIINSSPQTENGFFSLEVSTGNTFSNFYFSGYTPYVINNTVYSDTFIASGTVGTVLYYRIKNEKNYKTLCGDIISSIMYSETIPVTIQTNSINSY